MKKNILTLIVSVCVASTCFGQGLVNFVNTSVSNISTNTGLGPGQLGATSGLISGSTGNASAYYFALLMQSYSGSGPTVNSTLATVLTDGWTFTGLLAVNALAAGRLAGGASSATTAGDPTTGNPPNQFLVVGWSSGLGTTWATVSAKLQDFSYSFEYGNFIGISSTGTGTGQSASSETLFGTAGTGILSPITLYSVGVPEPTTMVLAGLGGLSLLALRRKK